MENSDIEQILITFGWEKMLRKDHLMLFRKYDHDLNVYCYKSTFVDICQCSQFDLIFFLVLVFGTFHDITALVFLQVQVSSLTKQNLFERVKLNVDFDFEFF